MGEDLIGEVAGATGLPQELVSTELCKLLDKAGLQPSEMTLEDLRAILAEYMQDTLLEAQEKFSGDQKKP